MGWRRRRWRSGNLIALRAEEAREERRGDRLLQLAWPRSARPGNNTHRQRSVRKSTVLWLRHKIKT